ncbi:protein TolQ [Desulfoluna sp.]|uniref:protein TolQ n=1 Tax=Desulfoluna sp. TaxID=2045199 RepID=UPI00260231E4|nr:protein TolQ [Desulfoluna sp.]
MANESLGIFQMISGAGPMVKLVLLTLLFFSITSWTIIILKFRTIRRAHKESLIFVETFWKSKNLSDAYSLSKELSYSSIGKVFRTAYAELKKLSSAGIGVTNEVGIIMGGTGIDNIRRTLRRATSQEVTRLMQLTPFLATAGSTAPFIGLFGTVWGIMNSFQGIAYKGSANLAVVAPGIAEALIATAVGLMVAIPSVIAYNYFSQRIRIIEVELNNFSADFLNIIERDIMRKGNGK